MKLGKRESPAEALAEARRLLAEGTDEDRLTFTERAVKRFPADPTMRLEYAAALADAGCDDAPAEALRAVDKVGDPAHLTRAAGLLLRLGELEAARSCAERAVLAGPTNVVVVNQLSATRGLIAARDGDYDLAESLLRTAHKADPTDEFFAHDLAAVIASSTTRGIRFAEALAVIDRTLATPVCVGENGEQARLPLTRLREKLQRDLDELARHAVLDGSATTSPVAPASDGDGVAAATTADDASAPDSPTDNGPPGRLVAHVEEEPPQDTKVSGDSRPAVQRRRRPTLILQPSLADAREQARRLLGRGQSKKYLSFTKRAVTRFPRDAAMRLEYATALAAFDAEKARAEARGIADLEFDDELLRAALLLRAGRLLLDLGDAEGARDMAERAAEPAPTFVIIINELAGLRGAVAAATGDDARAESELRKAHGADSVHSGFARDLAEFLVAHGRTGEALAVIERTLATPERPGVFESQASQSLARLLEEIKPSGAALTTAIAQERARL